LRAVLVAPSPKLQDQEVGAPVEVSAKPTVWPADVALAVRKKEATGAAVAAVTVTV
jgi:hypothetical protein